MFVAPDLESLLAHLNKLTKDSKALWGNMSAQRMVEHLEESLLMSIGEIQFPLAIAEEKLPNMLAFLHSDKAMAKNIEVAFAPKEVELKYDELELAIDAFTDTWLKFEEYYSENKNARNLHPYYGDLNFEEWKRLHSKHFTHHFEQFGIMQ